MARQHWLVLISTQRKISRSYLLIPCKLLFTYILQERCNFFRVTGV